MTDDVRRRIKAVIVTAMDGHEDLPADEVARIALSQLRDVMDVIALLALTATVEQERRERVRRIEVAVTRPRESATANAEQLLEAREERRQRRIEDEVEREHRSMERMKGLVGIIQRYTDDLRMQWTSELLAASFAVGDGTTVTWGEASAEQHEARVAMLTTQASGTLETAARHNAAIAEIRERGLSCLNDLTPAAV